MSIVQNPPFLKSQEGLKKINHQNKLYYNYNNWYKLAGFALIGLIRKNNKILLIGYLCYLVINMIGLLFPGVTNRPEIFTNC